jgi:hypothetical protein
MTHWPATLNTVVTLVAGGGLTMAGQALTDRRARRRDREARRETFLMQNFTAQREAVMKIQEMVDEFGNSYMMNCSGRSEIASLPTLIHRNIGKLLEISTSLTSLTQMTRN